MMRSCSCARSSLSKRLKLPTDIVGAISSGQPMLSAQADAGISTPSTKTCTMIASSSEMAIEITVTATTTGHRPKRLRQVLIMANSSTLRCARPSRIFPLPSAVDRRGDDQRDRNRHRSDNDRERHVLLLDDLAPQVVRRDLVDNDEADPEHEHADHRVDDRPEERGRFQPFDAHHETLLVVELLVSAAGTESAERSAAGAKTAAATATAAAGEAILVLLRRLAVGAAQIVAVAAARPA